MSKQIVKGREVECPEGTKLMPTRTTKSFPIRDAIAAIRAENVRLEQSLPRPEAVPAYEPPSTKATQGEEKVWIDEEGPFQIDLGTLMRSGLAKDSDGNPITFYATPVDENQYRKEDDYAGEGVVVQCLSKEPDGLYLHDIYGCGVGYYEKPLPPGTHVWVTDDVPMIRVIKFPPECDCDPTEGGALIVAAECPEFDVQSALADFDRLAEEVNSMPNPVFDEDTDETWRDRPPLL